ncbi:MAG: tetratricopeptide repeat protein [Rhodocyclaceae bacterium]|nr:tetratricopeptide repeat protein [Rhodocyclaceae bacterium]
MVNQPQQSASLNSVVRNFYLSLSLLVCAIAIALHSTGALAADASLHQVYEAAQSGDYKTAQGMMDQVLRDHPNSAKAHFVEAELLAKQGQLSRSETELRTAEKLDPSQSFAKPAAVQELKNLLATPVHAALPAARVSAPAAPGIPWGMIMAGLALVGAIVFFLRSRSQANQTYVPAGASGYASGPYGGTPQYGPTGPAPMGGAPGMGSTILGGLATGAAVGAGMVAGEALMHRVFDGSGNHAASNNTAFGNDLGPSSDNLLDDAERRYDMGGNDFGVSDASSWDDSSGGSDDWS